MKHDESRKSAGKRAPKVRGSYRGSRPAPPVGERFGRWLVLGVGEPLDRERWLVQCECGRTFSRQAQTIRDGISSSCVRCAKHDGHRKYENPTGRNGRHTREYKSYSGMLARCYDTRCRTYPSYGGRGIGVCGEWRDSFDAFVRDVGPSPGRGYSIDRIDNARGYEPGNVRWATAKTQARNTRRNHVLEVDGRAQCIAAWAEELGIRPQIISTRLRRGWSEREAVFGKRAA